MSLIRKIEEAISEATREKAEVLETVAQYGGSISESGVLRLQDGRSFFIKTHPQVSRFPGMFAAEFEALHLFAEVNVIKVPEPLAAADDFIVMEAIEFGERADDWVEQVGTQLALHHQKTIAEQFGFSMDNYIGTTPQPNTWSTNWAGFWREQRIGWQLEIFARKAGHDDPLLAAGEKLIAIMTELIGDSDEPPVLLHGDLWSGNAAADISGSPVLFDPASYYGHREAEIGMMRMFGGFGPRCEAAYEEVWPLLPEADRRISMYRLYHELNHLNLFGRSYYQGCLDTINSIL